MTKIFKNLKTDDLAQEEDRIGGFEPLETDIYDATIKVAYAGESARGASFVTFVLDIDGREIRDTQYITNREGDNFFYDKQDKKKKIPLPGFKIANDIALVATGEELFEQSSEEKMVKIYNPEEKKEVPTSVPVLTALTGEKVRLAITREVTNVNEQDDSGEWVPTEKTRRANVIDHVYDPESRMTVFEAMKGREEAGHHDKWLERFKGKDRDRTVKAGGASRGRSGTGRPTRSKEGRKQLFGKKS